jgi:hypothetical protein
MNRPQVMGDPLGLSPVVTDADVAPADFSSKLTYVFAEAAKKLPGEVGQALLNLVSPENIVSTVEVFAIWGAAHVIGIGFIADFALAGMSYYALGNAALDFVTGVLSIVNQINSATCLSNLSMAASTLLSTTNILIQQAAGRGKTGSAAIGAIFGGGKSKLPKMPPPNATPPSGRALVLHPTSIPKVAQGIIDVALKDGTLTKISASEWRSKGGLVYGTNPKTQETRIEHISRHLTLDPTRDKNGQAHSVFITAPDKLLRLLDEAWSKKGNYTIDPRSGNWNYKIDLHRPIGASGESTILISVRPGTTELITAFPQL